MALLLNAGDTVSRSYSYTQPSPLHPSQPQETGERTGNLFDKDTYEQGGINDTTGDNAPSALRVRTTLIPFEANAIYTFDMNNSFVVRYIHYYNSEKVHIGRSADGGVSADTFNTPSDLAYIRIVVQKRTATDEITVSEAKDANLMLNTGSTALPYEPFGVKIPILSANTTTPVYLGEVETTRKIKKLVFNGSEPWTLSGNIVYINNTDTMKLSPLICTHFPNVQNTGMWNGNNWIFQVDISNLGMSGRDAWISYLQQQYAAGTPVTIWYVLSTPTTGIVNEPLRKIGDYADTLSMEQAGVEIPTLNKPNNTVIDVETEVEPSEVDVTYRGSTKPKYDLFLANNGDSFEAKDGQSLYIGGDL